MLSTDAFFLNIFCLWLVDLSDRLQCREGGPSGDKLLQNKHRISHFMDLFTVIFKYIQQ